MANARVLTLQDDDIDFAGYMLMTDAEHKVRAVNSYRQDLHDEARGISEWGRVAYLPWGKTREWFQFRPGEVSLWVGFNGHGKSLMVGEVGMSLMAQGEVVLVLSFEMKPRRSLARMLRQWAGRKLDQVGGGEVDAFVDWCEGKLWMYDQQGTVDPKKVIAVVRWAIDKLGVTQVVIDNLGKTVKSEEDYDGQKAFTDICTVIGRDTNAHVHIVHHSRKQLNEAEPPRKQDSKGSGAVVDQVDNFFSVWKNKPKMEAKQRGDISKDQEPDAILLIDKQRNGEGWEGKIGLAFHYAAQQFIDPATYQPLDFTTPWPHAAKHSHGMRV